MTYLNDYLCTLLTYKKSVHAGVTRVLSPHSQEIQAACGTYAETFKFLCEAAGIPCLTVSDADHAWNTVYADGEWSYVNVSSNDVSNQHYILLAKATSNHADQTSEATAFLKELLVPGSTK